MNSGNVLVVTFVCFRLQPRMQHQRCLILPAFHKRQV